jgi:hypothetical protein
MLIRFSLCILICLASCGKKAIPVSNKIEENTEINEDLSEFRPVTEAKAIVSNNTNIPPKLTTEPLFINAKIDAHLAERAEKNKAVKYANGYRIQLYVGRERKQADDAKIFIYENFPNINPYLSYSLPIYKLKIGDFLTKNDAERVLNQLKNQYPEAIVVPEKIDVKKSFLKE